jgi:hypothetical protein
MAFQGIGKTFKEIYSEPGAGGTLSWGRVASTFTLIAAVVWVTRLVLQTHALPGLEGVTAFGLSPYIANKTGSVVQSFSQNPVTPNPNQPKA